MWIYHLCQSLHNKLSTIDAIDAFFLISIVTDHDITESNSFELAISLRFRFLWMSQLYIIVNWEGKQYHFSYLLQ